MAEFQQKHSSNDHSPEMILLSMVLPTLYSLTLKKNDSAVNCSAETC